MGSVRGDYEGTNFWYKPCERDCFTKNETGVYDPNVKLIILRA
jgi:hypothetical protein